MSEDRERVLLADFTFDTLEERDGYGSDAFEAFVAENAYWLFQPARGPHANGCICDINPETTDGPDIECPLHGIDAATATQH